MEEDPSASFPSSSTDLNTGVEEDTPAPLPSTTDTGVEKAPECESKFVLIKL